MERIHTIIQIALGIILGYGFIAEKLTDTNEYTGDGKINFEYAWPLIAYAVAIFVVWLVKSLVTTKEEK